MSPSTSGIYGHLLKRNLFIVSTWITRFSIHIPRQINYKIILCYLIIIWYINIACIVEIMKFYNKILNEMNNKNNLIVVFFIYLSNNNNVSHYLVKMFGGSVQTNKKGLEVFQKRNNK